jgi:uncharacterized protein HemX
MDPGFLLSLISLFITLLLGIGVFYNARKHNKTEERQLTVTEQNQADERDDAIAERRRVELERLYIRLDAMEEVQADLLARVDSYETQTVEMIHHIVRLENMVPNPPGPPSRPMWKLPILMKDHPSRPRPVME